MRSRHLQAHVQRGFTLIELLVVIAIIGLLATLATVAYSGTRVKARDAKRIADLTQIGKALLLYHDANGDFVGPGSGCGSGGNGQGWFNISYSGMDPIATCLSDAGFLSENVIDPTGDTTSNPTERNAYMKYHCTENNQLIAYVYAKLDTLPQESTATNGTCCPNCDANYGMNYYVRVPGE